MADLKPLIAYLIDQVRDQEGTLNKTALVKLVYLVEAGRTLIARVPGRPERKHFPKDDFHLDLVSGSCTCPAGQVTHTMVLAGKRTDAAGRVHRLRPSSSTGPNVGHVHCALNASQLKAGRGGG